MNEQIKRIGRQAGFVFIEDAVYGQRWYSSKCGMDASEYENLIELIVRECMWKIMLRKEEAIDNDWRVDEAMSTALSDIAEHFGVEE